MRVGTRAHERRMTGFHLSVRRQNATFDSERVAFAFGDADDTANAFAYRIQPADAVEHGPEGDPVHVLFERGPQRRIERIDGANHADATVADQIVEVRSGDEPRDATRDPSHERQQTADRVFTVFALFDHVFSRVNVESATASIATSPTGPRPLASGLRISRKTIAESAFVATVRASGSGAMLIAGDLLHLIVRAFQSCRQD